VELIKFCGLSVFGIRAMKVELKGARIWPVVRSIQWF
jgi:hypothetical protein